MIKYYVVDISDNYGVRSRGNNILTAIHKNEEYIT